MKTVFADSFYFFAIVNENDPAHEKAVALSQQFPGKMMTTGWVLTSGTEATGAVGSGFGPLVNDLKARITPIITTRKSMALNNMPLRIGSLGGVFCEPEEVEILFMAR